MINNIIYQLTNNADKNGNGVDLAEYQDYLQSQQQPASMADMAMSLFDLDKNGLISQAELESVYDGFDLDNNGRLNFNEKIAVQNAMSDIDIDPNSVTEYNYNSLFTMAKNLFSSINSSNTGEANLVEVQNYLSSRDVNPNGGNNYLNFYDVNNDGQINVFEILSKSISLDTSADGKISTEEAAPLSNQLTALTQIELSARNFVKMVDGATLQTDADGNIIRDGVVTTEEYQRYLTASGLNPDSAAVLINNFGSGGNISYGELVTAYKSYDQDNNGIMEFGEKIAFQNTLNGTNIPTDVTSTQYSRLYGTAASFIAKNDKNKDGVVSVEEYAAILDASNYDKADAAEFINFYDQNGDGISIYEFLETSISLDANNDGMLTYDSKDADGNVTEGEMHPVTSILRKLTNIELGARSLVRSLSKDKNGNLINADGSIPLEKYQEFVTNNKMPLYLAENMLTQYGSGTSISYDQLVAASNSFDADGNGTLNFSESIELQNTIANIDFDPAMPAAQYNKLLKLGQTFMGADVDKNGKVDIDELRAYVENLNAKMTNTVTSIPDGYAENMIMYFDQLQEDAEALTADGITKDAALDIFEYMQGLMQFDTDANGVMNSVETLHFKEQMFNTKLFDNVNEIYAISDASDDKKLTADEFKAYFRTQGLPTSLVDTMYEAFAEGEYDLDQDGELSRLEIMNLYKQFDDEGNANNQLDIDERLNLYSYLDSNRIDLGIDAVNSKQYANLFDSLQQYIMLNDRDNNGILNTDELKAYFKEQNLPTYIVEAFINQYDVANIVDGAKDENLDVLEIMKAYIDFDADKTGDLDVAEVLQMNSLLSGLELNATEDNKSQYTSIYNESVENLKKFDLNEDKLLDNFELNNYLASKELTSDYAANFVTTYDTVGNAGAADGMIDLLELMKSEIDFDLDKTGKLEFNEQMSLFKSISPVALDSLNPSKDNEIEYQRLYNTIKGFLTQYDLSQDKRFSETELIAFFKDKNLPASVARSLIDRFGQNNAVDTLQFLNAYVKYDVEANGYIQFAERLALDVDGTDVDVDSTEAHARQYEPLYNYGNSLVAYYDKIDNNQQLNEAELVNYFKDRGFSADIAAHAVELYDINKDGSLDSIELLKANIDYDTNQNGVIDQNEMLAQNATFAQISGVSADVASTSQVVGNFNYSNAILGGYDIDRNGLLSEEEAQAMFKKGYYIPNYAASQFVSLYDVNKDGGLNNLELMAGYIQADKDASGGLEFNELINFYGDMLGETPNVTAENVTQMSSLWNQVWGVMGYDQDQDRELTQADLEKWFVAQGLPASAGANFFASCINPNTGMVDPISLLIRFAEIDNAGNRNGSVCDFTEQLSLYSESSNSANAQVAVDSSNLNQISSLWGQVWGVMAYDKDGDRQLTEADIQKWFKDLGLPVSAGTNFFNAHRNENGLVDAMTLLQAFRDIDNNATNGNRNGSILDFAEQMQLFSTASNAANAQVEITAEETKQIASLWGQAWGVMGYDKDGDRQLTEADIQQWFKDQGMPVSQGTSFFNAHRNENGLVDAMTLLQAFRDIDNNAVNGNRNGSVCDFTEQLYLYSEASGSANAQVEITAEETKQVGSLWGQAWGVMAYDKDGDRQLTEADIQQWFKDQGMPAYMATSFFNAHRNENGLVDAMTLLQSFRNIDNAGNKNGSAVDFAELLSLFNSTTNADISINTENETQISRLWGMANGILGYDYNGNNDRLLSQLEIRNYFKDLGQASYVADNFRTRNDVNGDGSIDLMELTNALTTIDNAGENVNGIFEFEDYFRMYNNNSDIGITITPENRTQVQNLYNYASAVMGYDAGGNNNKELSNIEMNNYFRDLVMPQYMSNNFVSQADANGNGSVDVMELTRAFLSIDNAGTNQNGVFDFRDWMAFHGQVSNDRTEVTEDNLAQVSSLWNNYASGILRYDRSGNFTLSATELGEWFKGMNMSQAMADQFFNTYRGESGEVDRNGLLRAFMTIDSNKSGGMDFGEQVNLLESTSGINLSSGYASAEMIAPIYSQALGAFSYEIVNQDKQIQLQEFMAYAQAAMGSYQNWQAMAQSLFNSAAGGDGYINLAEMVRTFENFDADRNAVIDTAEWNTMWGVPAV